MVMVASPRSMPAFNFAQSEAGQKSAECRHKQQKAGEVGNEAGRHQERRGDYEQRAVRGGRDWRPAGVKIGARGVEGGEALQADNPAPQKSGAQAGRNHGQRPKSRAGGQKHVDLGNRAENEQTKEN